MKVAPILIRNTCVQLPKIPPTSHSGRAPILPVESNTNETQLTPEIDRTFVERTASEKFKIGQLKDEQWDIVHSIIIERRDTILNAATGFGKSLTLQII
jgi:superfamily II DNA helicase RecQ